MIYLDTHVVVWIGAGLSRKLSVAARRAVAAGDLVVSPVVALELEYLREIGRIRPSADEILSTLRHEIGLTTCDLAFEEVIRAARTLSWTRDPFDRLIGGHALAAGCRLVTADATMNEHLRCAVW